MDWLYRLSKEQKGVFIVFTAVLLPIILACAGLAMDLGNAFAHKSKLQNAADAAVLVYATLVQTDKTSAKEQTIKYMDANMHGESYQNLHAQIRQNQKDNKSMVTLYATKNVPTTFMRILGFDAVPVSVEATCNIPTSSTESHGAGVFGYSFIGAANDDKPSLNFTSTTQKINGDVHTNGKAIASWITIGNSEQRCVLVNGKFTSATSDDMQLWNKVSVNQYQVNAEPLKHVNDIPFEGNTPDPDATIKNTVSVPWDSKYSHNQYWHLLCFGYDDGTPYGRDITAAESFDKSIGNNGNIDISLRENSADTGEIYKYVKKFEEKYVNWREPAWDYVPAEWVNTTPGRAFNDYHAYPVIIADGNINLSTQNVDWNAEPMVIISLHGNIEIDVNQDGNKLNALIYAPNGDIIYNGSRNFEGSMIAQHITSNISNITFKHNDFGFGSGNSSGGNTGSGSVNVLKESIKLLPSPENDNSYAIVEDISF